MERRKAVVLNTASLVNLDEGRFAAALDCEFQRVMKDLDERPQDDRKRTIAVKIHMYEPDGDINRGVTDLRVAYEIPPAKLPPQKSRSLQMQAVHRKDRQGEPVVEAEFIPGLGEDLTPEINFNLNETQEGQEGQG